MKERLVLLFIGLILLSGCSGQWIRNAVGGLPKGVYTFYAYKDGQVIASEEHHIEDKFNLGSKITKMCEKYPAADLAKTKNPDGKFVSKYSCNAN
ncbi:hypothetical protein H0A36_23045 [Endozoicomonas sp. SM1973]|uniref:Lipoprotein n=1 Tax=Spartinivicinus marinus TaxID=2994442 RepID=A0A853IFZ4_9GAMM|nr:hypothetical protein [Spartinivicinus marinus]MCX4027524.1 hypothetical protein [Spartinivicinus marinus]NYZ68901.1 hypothetical protein [Spartinivicinus marinus]